MNFSSDRMKHKRLKTSTYLLYLHLPHYDHYQTPHESDDGVDLHEPETDSLFLAFPNVR